MRHGRFAGRARAVARRRRRFCARFAQAGGSEPSEAPFHPGRRQSAQPEHQVRLRHPLRPDQRPVGCANNGRAGRVGMHASDSRDHQQLQPSVGAAAADGRAHGSGQSDPEPELADARGSRQHARARWLRGHPPVAGGAISARAATACAVLQSLPGETLAVSASGAYQLDRRPTRAASRQRNARPRARGKRNRAGSQRGRQYRKRRATSARDGRRHRDRLRRGPLARRHLRRDRGGHRAPSGTPYAAAEAKRRGQGRRGAPGFCRGRGRGADDPRRRPDGCAGGFAALLSGATFGPRRISSMACASSTRWRSRRCAF